MAIVKTTPNQTGTASPTGNNPSRGSEVTKAGASSSPRPVARPGAARAPQSAAKPGGAFIQETSAELKKVVWPSKEDVRGGTIVTVLLLVAFGAYIYGLDALFTWLFGSLGLS